MLKVFKLFYFYSTLYNDPKMTILLLYPYSCFKPVRFLFNRTTSGKSDLICFEKATKFLVSHECNIDSALQVYVTTCDSWLLHHNDA